MQRVAELVKQRLRIRPGDQDDLAWCAFEEVAVVRNQGGDHLRKAFLGAIAAHPGPGPFTRPGVRIEVKQPHLATRRVVDPPHANIRVVDRHVRCRGKRQTEQFPGRPEHPLPQLIELQVRFQFVFIQVEFCFAHFLGVITVVPRFDPDARAFRVGQCLHVRHFLAHPRHRRGPHRFEQFHRPVRGSGHGVFEAPVRVGLVAEQLGPFGAQGQDFADHRFVIARARMIPAADEVAPDLLAQVAPRRVGEKRFHA